MRLMNRVFKSTRSSSRQVAKERLQLVLVHDRAQISPQLLQTLKDEIIAVISQHVAIEREGVEITLAQNRATVDTLTLKADLLTFGLEGKMDISRSLITSPLNLKGKIKLSGTLASQYQPMLAQFLRKQDKDGFYIFSIRGNLAAPRVSL